MVSFSIQRWLEWFHSGFFHGWLLVIYWLRDTNLRTLIRCRLLLHCKHHNRFNRWSTTGSTHSIDEVSSFYSDDCCRKIWIGEMICRSGCWPMLNLHRSYLENRIFARHAVIGKISPVMLCNHILNINISLGLISRKIQKCMIFSTFSWIINEPRFEILWTQTSKPKIKNILGAVFEKNHQPIN